MLYKYLQNDVGEDFGKAIYSFFEWVVASIQSVVGAVLNFFTTAFSGGIASGVQMFGIFTPVVMIAVLVLVALFVWGLVKLRTHFAT